LVCAAVFHGAFIGALPVFFLCLLAGAVFYDGGFANIPPYCVELFPVRMAAQGGGLGQTVTGVAKVAGPALLALIAGQSNLLSPKATEAAILPAFLVLAAFCAVGGIAVSFLRYETHGRSMAIQTPQEVEATLQAETVGMV
jgi:putative MFS transporter